jgi:hypothetical protein
LGKGLVDVTVNAELIVTENVPDAVLFAESFT